MNSTNNGKTLEVYAALIDATKTTEEVLAGYAAVRLKAAVLMTTASTRQLLNRCGVQIDAAKTIDVPKEGEASLFNGNVKLGDLPRPEKPTVLIVNGNLRILQDEGDALSAYHQVIVNGNLVTPDRLSGAGKIQVNGNWRTYPADAVYLGHSLRLDSAFVSFSKPDTLYYAGQVKIVEESFSLRPLVEKKVRIACEGALVRQELMEDAGLVLEQGILPRMIPTGCRYLEGEYTLGQLSARGGTRVVLDGDLSLEAGDRETLEAFEYLEVNGTVRLPAELELPFYKHCQKYGDVVVARDEESGLITDQMELEVTGTLLGEYPHGLRIADCMTLKISPDVPLDLLRERLLWVEECMTVICTPEQKGVLLPRSSEVLQFRVKPQAEDPNLVTVRSASYTL